MPKIVDYIYEIAIEKQRGVLFLVFDPDFFRDRYKDQKWIKALSAPTEWDEYQNWEKRNEIIEWLEEKGIEHMTCLIRPSLELYETPDLYIDVPFDNNNTKYRELEAFLESGTNRCIHEGVSFYYMPLEIAYQWKKQIEKTKDDAFKELFNLQSGLPRKKNDI